MWQNTHHKRCEVLSFREGSFYTGFKKPINVQTTLKKEKKITCLAITLEQFLFYGKLKCIHLYKVHAL